VGDGSSVVGMVHSSTVDRIVVRCTRFVADRTPG